MTDEYWKKRARDLEHHQPAHISQNKSLDDVLNNVPGMPPSPNAARPNNSEIDMSALLAQRLAGAMSQAPQGPPPARPQAQMVFVKEGVRAYRQLEAQAYGSSQPLARFVGPIHGVNGKEFEFKGPVDAYIIEGNEPVDFANPDPSKIKRLVVIQAPFIGKLLVPESAVFGSGGPVRQVLKG